MEAFSTFDFLSCLSGTHIPADRQAIADYQLRLNFLTLDFICQLASGGKNRRFVSNILSGINIYWGFGVQRIFFLLCSFHVLGGLQMTPYDLCVHILIIPNEYISSNSIIT